MRTLGQPPDRVRSAWHRAARRPVVAAAAVAAVGRFSFAVVSFLVNRPQQIPDERQYLDLAATVARGGRADDWFPHYGQSLYDSTWAFVAPLVRVVAVLGESRLVGQLYVVVVGVGTVVALTALAERLLGRAEALAVGLVAAVLPSQVLWSSVVLRETFVWLGLVLAALSLVRIERAESRNGCVAGLALLVLALLLLGKTRQQTAVVGVWATAGASLLLWRRPFLMGGVALVAVAVPFACGLGLLGIGFVAHETPDLAATRAYLSLDAKSALHQPDEVAPAETSATSLPARHVERRRGRDVVRTADGRRYEVEDGAAADVRAIPPGTVAVLIRPFPWERGGSLVRLAAIENVLWLVLYVLAVIGCTLLPWRRPAWAYTVLVVGGLVLSSAMSQGNVGTAFRHRGQVLWAVALLAALGVRRLASAQHTR